MNDSRQAYLEAHSALNGALLAYGVLPAAAGIVCLTVGVAAGQSWLFVPVGALFALVLVSVALLYRNWPTGVLVDGSGISIGAVRSARAARRRPTVNHQSWGRYTCPWPAVLGARIVTDRDELRQMRNSSRYYTLTNRWSNKRGMRRCNIGVLSSPFMRAALVIEVNPFAVTAGEIRSARFFTNFKDGHFSHLVQPQLSPTWVVPTRHPVRLSAALRAVRGLADRVDGFIEDRQALVQLRVADGQRRQQLDHLAARARGLRKQAGLEGGGGHLAGQITVGERQAAGHAPAAHQDRGARDRAAGESRPLPLSPSRRGPAEHRWPDAAVAAHGGFACFKDIHRVRLLFSGWRHLAEWG